MSVSLPNFSDASMQHARRLELRQMQAPGGLEVHADGMFHEVQRGERAPEIAREYAERLQLNVSVAALRAANPGAFANGLQRGELLTIPGIERRTDARYLASHPSLSEVRGRLVHTVTAGETLSGIAREYASADGTRLSWQVLADQNRYNVPDPSVIRVGQQLVVPGVTSAAPIATNFEISELKSRPVIAETGTVVSGWGEGRSVELARMKLNTSKALYSGASIDEAIERLGHPGGWPGAPNGDVAIVQTRQGAYYVAPLVTTSTYDGFDHDDHVVSSAHRALQPGIVGVVVGDGRDAGLRRFDQ